MNVKYAVLNGEIARKGLLKKDVAKSINVSYRSFRNKMMGIAPFTWEEVNTIRLKYFPEHTLSDLFATNDENTDRPA